VKQFHCDLFINHPSTTWRIGAEGVGGKGTPYSLQGIAVLGRDPGRNRLLITVQFPETVVIKYTIDKRRRFGPMTGVDCETDKLLIAEKRSNRDIGNGYFVEEIAVLRHPPFQIIQDVRDLLVLGPLQAVIDDPTAALLAVKAGLGMAILPCFMADREDGIFRMPPGKLQLRQDLWILTHQDLRKTARIRKFTSHMAEAVARHRDLIEGKCARKKT
jgi:LysR substrate binding domain-containing protein